MSYQNGLPIYRSNPTVQKHTINAMRYIFHCAKNGSPGGSAALKRLAEAYQSCQAEQGRTIDDLYGKLSGRDASLRDQVLALVDLQKALTLEAVVHKLNPRAASTDDGNPSGQAPHITSAYLEAVGKELGMRGVAAAKSDANRPRGANRAVVLEEFRSLFNVEELALALVSDVNQQSQDAERTIDRDLLAKWAAAEAEASGGTFDAYSIYFDEDRASEYEGRPGEGAEYQPFLNRRTSIGVLLRLFLATQGGGPPNGGVTTQGGGPSSKAPVGTSGMLSNAFGMVASVFSSKPK